MARLILIATLICATWAALAEVEARAPDPALLYAAHEKRGRFFLPWHESRRSAWRFLQWQLSSNPYDKSQPIEVAIVPNDGSSLSRFEPGASATWVGHATFAIHEGNQVFLTDPHFTKRALIPARKTPPGVPIESIPGDAFAIVSHNHYDHLDRSTVKQLPETVHWFVPLGLGEWFHDLGRERVTELDWWESGIHGDFTVTCLPSQHWSARIEHGENETLWCSWLIDSGKRRYYHAGDTGYFHGFSEYARRYGRIDVAMLPIGAYEPRWFMEDQHLDPAQAVQAFRDLRARYMLSMHWGTFDLTDEPVDEPPKELARVLGEEGDERVRVMAIGERFVIPDAD